MFTLPAWLIFSILTGFASNAFNFLARYILKEKTDPIVFLWYIELAKLIVFLPAAILIDWKLVLSPETFAFLLLTGFTQLIGGYFWVKMHELSHLSISTIISRTRMIWVPIIAFFIIGEQLKLFDYVAIVVLFLGVSIISAPHKLFVDKGAMYANAAALLVAFNIVFSKISLDYASNSLMIVFHALPSVILLPLLMKNSKERFKESLTHRFKLKTFAASTNLLTFLFFVLAIREGDASKVNAVYQGMLFLSVLAGIIFLKEREDIPRKLIGTAVTVAGVIMLSLY